MGKIKKGILGGFSGKVGTVVGASWKGIAYMRSLPQKVRNPRTEPQRMQRSKFALSLNFLQPMNGLLRTGWKLQAHRQSPINAAMSYTINNAISGSYPNYSIDPSKVYISRGALAPAVNASASAAQAATVVFNWSDNSGTSAASKTDKVLLAVVNPEKSEAVLDSDSANLLRCIRCGSVRGFLTFCGSERMYAMPFQLAPTTVPTFPEKPPKIPFLIFPIFYKFLRVNNCLYLDLVRLWCCADLIR
jgi:hypothetical protein